MKLLIWLTQLGLSLIVPLASFTLLGLWLHSSLGWGRWVLVAGMVLGIITGVQSLWSAVKIMARMEKPREENHPQAFQEHD